MQTITIPYATKSQNETDRMHPMALSRWRNTVADELWLMSRRGHAAPYWPHAKLGKMRKADDTECKVTARITRGGSRELDHGNFVGGCKALVDALVAHGFLFDDAPRYCEIEYVQEKTTRKNEFTRIDLEIAQ